MGISVQVDFGKEYALCATSLYYTRFFRNMQEVQRIFTVKNRFFRKTSFLGGILGQDLSIEDVGSRRIFERIGDRIRDQVVRHDGLHGHIEPEGRALTHLTLHTVCGTVRLQDLLDDGQSQSRTDHGAAMDSVNLVVAIPDQGDLVGGYYS